MLEDVMDTAKKGLDVDYESVRNVFKHYSTLEKKAKNQVNIEKMKRENSGSSTQYTNNPTKSDLTLAKGTEHESRGSIKNQEENFKKIFNKSETPLQILSSGKNNFKFFY